VVTGWEVASELGEVAAVEVEEVVAGVKLHALAT
jgi:hypothetical protein